MLLLESLKLIPNKCTSFKKQHYKSLNATLNHDFIRL